MINSAYFSDVDLDHPSTPKQKEVCIANISPLERQRRLRFGIGQFLFTILILIVLILLHANPLWRLLLLFPFWAAALGYFQAHDKTWVSLASRGSRKLSDREEKIEDKIELAQVRRQARRVIFKAFLVAVVITWIVFLIPL